MARIAAPAEAGRLRQAPGAPVRPAEAFLPGRHMSFVAADEALTGLERVL